MTSQPNRCEGAGRNSVDVTGIDAYSPAEIAARVESAGTAKAKLPLDKLFTLGLLAGIFIAFGGTFYTLTVTGSTLGFEPTKLLGGAAFSLGLVLVVVAGAELFTGNTLIVMAWADGDVSLAELFRNWTVALLANAAGAVLIAILVYYSGVLDAGSVRETAVKIAEGKLGLGFIEAFIRGILCNALVCLAVWLTFAARRVSGKAIAVIFPITAFVALGFEHSIANFYLIPVGMLAGAEGTLGDVAGNLVPVTLGNIVGGAGGVAAVYWIIYGKRNNA
ncbi:MAG: formate/nitrite transporter family protein [Hyphomicrobiaceae bacterium]|nr:formate/nitrite transporter family protein [Hyphomicrobiaceae bacterium]